MERANEFNVFFSTGLVHTKLLLPTNPGVHTCSVLVICPSFPQLNSMGQIPPYLINTLCLTVTSGQVRRQLEKLQQGKASELAICL